MTFNRYMSTKYLIDDNKLKPQYRQHLWAYIQNHPTIKAGNILEQNKKAVWAPQSQKYSCD